ncbi:FkbH domain protein [Legionella massiliensis]|uniref:FkbH domain protein n=1 Tax=Legionella massiliensis TaxID=1034943 RepID=A0A078L199_9GAMM|nr:HAD-IIIC family phosphatase [Legionella massiliensis]CDZ77843.1 FkbH domain protein [Legionella massiliensis]CEE13581.1 hypothetical protein BN1094_02136 [Legionella massiliensis]
MSLPEDDAADFAEKWVKIAYQSILGRDADEAGLKAHMEAIKSEAEIPHLLRSFVNSQEHIDNVRRGKIANVEPPYNYQTARLPTTQAESLDQETLNAKILLLGTCGISGFVDYFPENCKVDNILWGSSQIDLLPEVDLENYDAVVVSLTLRHILGANSVADTTIGKELLWAQLHSEDELQGYFDSCKELLDSKVALFASCSKKVKVLFLSFLEPTSNHMGYLFPRFHLRNPSFFVMKLNEAMSQAVSAISNAYYLDINEILNGYGKYSVQDDSVLYIGHASYVGDYGVDYDNKRLQQSTLVSQLYQSISPSKTVFYTVAHRIIDSLKIIKQTNPIKIIITDLDDTLWRGVAADDAMPDWQRLEGWPLGYIEALLIFKARGGLLAIASKNSEEETKIRFNKLLGDRISLDAFVSLKINFEPKSKNIAEILKEVNILPANALFIDDNPREIDEVKHLFPEIRTLSKEHYDWRRQILTSVSTQVASISSESANRTASIQALIERNLHREQSSHEDWLASLCLTQHHVLLQSIEHHHFQRAFELLNKTNQFNTTGRRWDLREVAELFDQGGFFVSAFLKDKTMDSGLIAVAIVQENKILQVVLSCRVFGLGVEYAMGRLVTLLILKNYGQVTATIEDSGKNLTCHAYFKNMGFHQSENHFYSSTVPEAPQYIHLDSSKNESIEFERATLLENCF